VEFNCTETVPKANSWRKEGVAGHSEDELWRSTSLFTAITYVGAGRGGRTLPTYAKHVTY
jgi:hypothetical protein